MGFSRREFLRALCLGALGMVLPKSPLAQGRGFVKPFPSPYFEPLGGRAVRCTLCPRGCELDPGDLGHCGARRNDGGRLSSLTYANPCALHIDPIEKKPFFHLLPGTPCLSYAMAGCNLDCLFCQNWQISQVTPLETENLFIPPEEMVRLALEKGCPTLSATYTEPTVFHEYNLEVARLCKENGVLFLIHSNGFINPKPLEDLLPYLGAACIDLKAFRDRYYREVTGGWLEPVLETLKAIHAHGVHLEIVNLVLPGMNDDPEEIREMCLWIRDTLSPSVPLHFTRFFPTYRLRNLPPTPVKTLEGAREIAREVGLRFVYIGNVPGHPGENTYCPRCGALIIERKGFFVTRFELEEGRCPRCQEAIEGIWTT